MISQETLDSLKGIGLNLYERKLYAALLARGTSTAGELSEISRVPRSRSYDVLESLAEKGFVVVQHAKPLKYVAVAPDEALERTKNRLKQKLEEGTLRIEQFKKSEALEELKNLYSNGVSLVDAADMSGALKGRYSLNQQMETMFKGANSKIDIITTEDGLNELWNTHSKLFKNSKKKGIQIRIIAPVTPRNKDAAKALSKGTTLKNLNSAKVKNIPSGRICLVDGKELVMALTDDKNTHSSQDVSFWTSSGHFTKNFAQTTFDMVWKNLD